jgi:hypothetical protein
MEIEVQSGLMGQHAHDMQAGDKDLFQGQEEGGIKAISASSLTLHII